jgi:hypothetical protein
MPKMIQGMEEGKTGQVRNYVRINGGGIGSATGSPAQLNDAARQDLLQAQGVAGEYAAAHGTYTGFDRDAAFRASPKVLWADAQTYMQFPPNFVYLQPIGTDGIFLAARSETGAVYCIRDDGKRSVTFGTADTDLGLGSPVGTDPVCSSGGWPDGEAG